MALIILGGCIDVKDGDCAKVCPVDCIYEGVRMFYIHPVECIECGLCESICPVDAIRYDDEVTLEEAPYVAINREFFEDDNGLRSPGGWDKSDPPGPDHPTVAAAPPNIAGQDSQKDKGAP